MIFRSALIFTFFLFFFTAYARNHVVLEEGYGRIILPGYEEAYPDMLGKLDFESVIQLSDEFKRYPEDFHFYELRARIIWFKLGIINKTESTTHNLVFFRKALSNIKVLYKLPGQEEYLSAKDNPSINLSLGRDNAIDLKLNFDEFKSIELLIGVEQIEANNIIAYIADEKTYLSTTEFNILSDGIIYGIVLVGLGLATVLYLTTKLIYLKYFLLFQIITFMHLIWYKELFAVFEPILSSDFLTHLIHALLPGLMIVIFIKYMLEFCRPVEIHDKLVKIIYEYGNVFLTVVFFLFYFFPIQYILENNFIFFAFLTLMTIGYSAIGYVIYTQIKEKKLYIYLVSIAFSIISLGSGLTFLSLILIAPINDYTANIFYSLAILTSVIFSMLSILRYNNYSQEYERQINDTYLQNISENKYFINQKIEQFEHLSWLGIIGEKYKLYVSAGIEDIVFLLSKVKNINPNLTRNIKIFRDRFYALDNFNLDILKKDSASNNLKGFNFISLNRMFKSLGSVNKVLVDYKMPIEDKEEYKNYYLDYQNTYDILSQLIHILAYKIGLERIAIKVDLTVKNIPQLEFTVFSKDGGQIEMNKFRNMFGEKIPSDNGFCPDCFILLSLLMQSNGGLMPVDPISLSKIKFNSQDITLKALINLNIPLSNRKIKVIDKQDYYNFYLSQETSYKDLCIAVLTEDNDFDKDIRVILECNDLTLHSLMFNKNLPPSDSLNLPANTDILIVDLDFFYSANELNEFIKKLNEQEAVSNICIVYHYDYLLNDLNISGDQVFSLMKKNYLTANIPSLCLLAKYGKISKSMNPDFQKFIELRKINSVNIRNISNLEKEICTDITFLDNKLADLSAFQEENDNNSDKLSVNTNRNIPKLRAILSSTKNFLVIKEDGIYEFIPSDTKENSYKYFNNLVSESMNYVINLWVKYTGKDISEFAESSGIWKLTRDDYRLRARTLENYLKPETVPENPRMGSVTSSLEFIRNEIKDMERNEYDKIGNYIQIFTGSNS